MRTLAEGEVEDLARLVNFLAQTSHVLRSTEGADAQIGDFTLLRAYLR